jgi:hypothetical protein
MLALSKHIPAHLKKDKKLLHVLAADLDPDSGTFCRHTGRELQVPEKVRRILAKIYNGGKYDGRSLIS